MPVYQVDYTVNEKYKKHTNITFRYQVHYKDLYPLKTCGSLNSRSTSLCLVKKDTVITTGSEKEMN